MSFDSNCIGYDKHINGEGGTIKVKGQKKIETPQSQGSDLRYLEIRELSHLLNQKKGNKSIYKDKNWRESYYFNATDQKKEISLITTIGILPNKKRCSGFVIIIHKKKVIFSKLIISTDIRWDETDRFRLGNLVYEIEGIDWHLKYRSRKCSLDILFRPINEFFTYSKKEHFKDAGNFERLFSQHIEQGGIFEGEIILNQNRMKFGPSFGHRDHSWGIRDWASIDNYWLFSCIFARDMAFNLWNGSSGGIPFHNGYFYDSERNLKILSSDIKGQFINDTREPLGCELKFEDENHKTQMVKCEVICCVPIPMPKCVIYETIAKMRYEDEIGFGLLEHLVHDSNPFHKVSALMDLKKRIGGGGIEIHR